MKGKYIIVNLISLDYMKNAPNGDVCMYDTLKEAKDVCAIHELTHAWVLRFEHYHVEEEPA